MQLAKLQRGSAVKWWWLMVTGIGRNHLFGYAISDVYVDGFWVGIAENWCSDVVGDEVDDVIGRNALGIISGLDAGDSRAVINVVDGGCCWDLLHCSIALFACES